MTQMKITDFEKDVLINGLENSEFNTINSKEVTVEEYGEDRLEICIWSDCIVDNCELITENQISGVVSSLVKKGLVEKSGRGRDSVVTVTKEGFKIIKEFLKEEEEKEEVDFQPLSNKTIPEAVDEKMMVTDESNVTLIQTVEILDGEVKGIESIMESIGWSEQVENELEEATDAKRKIKTQLEKLENPHYMADPRKEVRRLFNDGLTSLSCAYDYLSEHITNIMNRGDFCRNQSLVSLSESIKKRGRKIEGMKIPR